MTTSLKNPSKVLIVSPALNEQKILPRFIAEFLKLREQLKLEAELRVLIVNDGSTDETQEVLQSHAEAHPGVIGYLAFPASFGHQQALIAGLLNVGQWPDAVITMDSDLEHPMELVPKMIAEWRTKKLVMVNTLRESHEQLSVIKRFLSNFFYHTTSSLTGLDLNPGQADFRLWDASVLRAVSPHLPFVGSLRVFSAWLPGRKEFIPYRQHVQEGRRSRFTFKKNLEFWKVGVVRYSTLPLRVIALGGALGLIFSLLYGIYIVVSYWEGKTVQGWSSTNMAVLVMGCVQLISLGVVASYLNRLVFAKDLPLYVVQQKKVPWN
jgi:dolichol-phosphate mannosyltransferase